MRLTIIIDVSGTKTLPRSPSMRMSPGRRPNQLNIQGANCIAAPQATSTMPITISHQPVEFIALSCARLSVASRSHELNRGSAHARKTHPGGPRAHTLRARLLHWPALFPSCMNSRDACEAPSISLYVSTPKRQQLF